MTHLYKSLFPQISIHKHNIFTYDYNHQVIFVHIYISFMKIITSIHTSRKSYVSSYNHVQFRILNQDSLCILEHRHKHISPTSRCPYIIHIIQHVRQLYIHPPNSCKNKSYIIKVMLLNALFFSLMLQLIILVHWSGLHCLLFHNTDPVHKSVGQGS